MIVVEDGISQTLPSPIKMKPTKKKYHLFLDLDETLIHSFTTARMDFDSEEEKKEHFDQLERQMIAENGVKPTREELETFPSEMVFNIRPATEEFLLRLSEHYEINIFTAGEQDYADQILDHFDTSGEIISNRLYRHNTDRIEFNGALFYIKDLSRCDRDLTKTIIIDNIRDNFCR